jgi:ubiquinone/menaquinone biosynthesis C-methylase UbiE
MSKTFSKPSDIETYNTARALPKQTMQLWMNALKSYVPAGKINKILDLGCGTGRFSFALEKEYSCSVVAMDPSEAMLNKGRTESNTNIEWLQGTAETIPLPCSCVDLVWMSQVIHHLDDNEKAFREIHRVINDQGFLAVRNSMREHLDEIIWYTCFPEALKTDKARLVSQDKTVNLIIKYGFELLAADTIHQLFASTCKEYFEKVSQRGLSSLITISDEVFNAGKERMRKWVDQRADDEPVYEPIDLIIFQKVG